jgi:hypothetical protein
VKKKIKHNPNASVAGILAGKLFTLLHEYRHGITVIAFLLTVISIAFMVSGALRGDSGPETIDIVDVPLTSENLSQWIDASIELGRLREGGNLEFSGKSLPALLEWGKNHPGSLRLGLTDMDAGTFLGISSSLDKARTNLREIVEYDMLLEEEAEMEELLDEAFYGAPLTPAPDISPLGEEDLEVYQLMQSQVEDALYILMPGIPLPVPAWEEEEAEAPEDENPGPPKRPMRWRVVSKSKYGPKVVRVQK